MSAVVEARPRAREALRAATDAIHRRLHALPAFVSIVDGTIGMDDYRELLARLHGFHAPLDAAFAQRADAFARYDIAIAPRSRVGALADDLSALGVAGDAIAGLPRMPLSLAGQTTAALFGHLYVRDGAALGGRVIERHLDRLLGARTRGRTFFAGDACSGERWRATCAALERVAAQEPAGLDHLLAGATRCFAGFERWMT